MVFQGTHVVGTFPKGFKIKVSVSSNYVDKIAKFVVKRLGSQPRAVGAVHIFVAERVDGSRLMKLLSNLYNCRFVSSETSKEEVNQVASEWSKGEFDVLISTSIALVGNENSRCRYLACAGFMYDAMQIVQAFGRLRQFMRTPAGQFLFAVPDQLPAIRITEDTQRYTRLLNEDLIPPDYHSHFKSTMTSQGVYDWLIVASQGQKGCALKSLSSSFGKITKDCGACPYCRSIPVTNFQLEAAHRIDQERRHEQSAETVLRRLALVCLACKKATCRGLPVLNGPGSMQLPENRGCCFSWKNCYQCGVGQHDRKDCPFDKTYMNGIACCECWVFKDMSGTKRHEKTDCKVHGRLRRLLSHHFLKFRVSKPFQKYMEEIYTSTESFCHFLATVEEKYI